MFANVNGYNIFFDVEGLQYVPDGPKMREKPVCFVVHGGPGGDHTHYMPALTPLAEVMQLVYIDDRNCGLSDVKDYTTSSIKQNVDDIEAVRKYLGLGKIFLLGQSYGGMKAQRYAIDYSENLYGVIICCTSSCAEGIDGMRVLKHVEEYGTPEQYEIWKSNAVQTGKMTFTEYMDKMGPLYHGKGKFNLQEAIDGNLRAMKSDEVIRFQMGEGGELTKYDLRPELKKITAPSMILCGDQDFICDMEANKEIHDNIPGSEFHVIEGASHEIFHDFPDISLGYIKDFVARNFKK